MKPLSFVIPLQCINNRKKRQQLIMRISYLKKANLQDHVSNDLIEEFEKMLPNDCKVREVRKSALDNLLLRVNYKLPNISLPLYKKEMSFSMCMGIGDFRFFIKQYKLHTHNSVYLFDAWPIYYDMIEFFCKSLNISNLFCSSQIASENLGKRLKNTKVNWQPEAINVACYKQKDYNDRSIDVLQFGRNFSDIQERLANGLKEKSINYVYQKDKLVFSTREDFINGLASAKISLCFPRSLTNPEIAHQQETMTARYLQSMASKTLIVGKCPQEMTHLFPYHPVVDLDLEHPDEHIKHLLDNYEDYIPLIERNYQEVKNHHQWINRWNNMKEFIHAS